MTNRKILFVYPDHSGSRVLAFVSHFRWHAAIASTMDLAAVAETARAVHCEREIGEAGKMLRALAPGHTKVLVRLWRSPVLGDDITPSLVLDAPDDCADEWRDLTKHLFGLRLTVITTPLDGSGAETTYRYWEGKRRLISYASGAAA